MKIQNDVRADSGSYKAEHNVKSETKNSAIEAAKKEYSEINKDGDTLELTTDAALKKYSKVKLKQLLIEKKITKLQYDRVVKN